MGRKDKQTTGGARPPRPTNCREVVVPGWRSPMRRNSVSISFEYFLVTKRAAPYVDGRTDSNADNGGNSPGQNTIRVQKTLCQPAQPPKIRIADSVPRMKCQTRVPMTDIPPPDILRGMRKGNGMTSGDMITALERERYKRGLTLFEFSDEIGISMSSYVHWVYRNQRPNADKLFKAMESAGFEIKIGRKEDGLS